MPAPNIVLIIADQMRADCLAADGNPLIHTPNLDYLASAGARFRHAYSAVPSCIPARATLWSGQSQWHTGVLGMGGGQGPIPNDFPHTLAGELSQAGYHTHLVGKGHFHPQRAPMGFQSMELDESGRTLVHGVKDEYREFFAQYGPPTVTPDDHGVAFNSWHARPWHCEEYLHPSGWIGSRAIHYLEHRDRSKPFFLNLSFERPHSPYVPPQAYWDMYINGDTKPAVIGEWAQMHDDPITAADPNAWRGRLSPEQIHRARAGYYGDVSFIDTQVGRLINLMARFDNAAYGNTWFIFTADHGDMLGDHNLWRKTYAYEGSARVPLIVCPPLRGPRPQNRVVSEVVEWRDLMPTILAAAGVAIPRTVDGASLLPLLQAPQPDWREYIHGEHCTCYHSDQEMQFVTNGKRKFIWLPRLNMQQFFDLESDPGECHDLSQEPARQAEVAQWRGYLIKELAARDCGWVKDGQLHAPPGNLISPWKTVRWPGPATPG